MEDVIQKQHVQIFQEVLLVHVSKVIQEMVSIVLVTFYL